jgi:hypothetical protein
MAGEPTPVILYNPELTINAVSLKCLMSHIEMTPDVTTIEITTSCGVREYPGRVKWTLKAHLYHSFDPEGTNEVLTAAVVGGVPVDFTVVPSSSQPISETNPEFVGQLIPQPFAPLAGDVGDSSEIDLEWSIVGWTNVPTTNIVPGGAVAAEAETTPADQAEAVAV